MEWKYFPVIQLPNRPFISNSHSPTSHLPHPHLHPDDNHTDIEMLTIPAVKYTSLRDIIPHHPPPPPPPIISPASNSSWNEIPIKNPLLKQAALAYLQPMSTPPGVASKVCLLDRLKDKCFCRSRGQLGCFHCINAVFFKTIAQFFLRFCERRAMDDSEVEDEEEENVD